MRHFRKIQVQRLSSDFRKATQIVDATLASPAEHEIVVKNYWVGINASDINYTSGRYLKGVDPPFDAGFESLGKVEQIGSKIKHLSVGDYVAVTAFGCFSEYQIVKANRCVKVPQPDKAMLPLLVSGLTASLSLEHVGNMTTKQTILVTAAAGATGSFAVQLAKLAGNHVVGTCSSDEKVSYLRSLGCDRVINYNKENLNTVLSLEYPNGIDIVYESVGGETFEICVDNLAVRGVLIVIGMVSSYKDQSVWSDAATVSTKPALPMRMLQKSASIRGFFLNHFLEYAPEHMARLANLVLEGKIQSSVDPTEFEGLEQVPEAIDYLFSGRNMGKVVVKLHGEAKL